MTYIPENFLPAGTIVAFGGVVAPAGWLFCRGQTVRRDDYPNLFLVIREYYGAGDGSTTFSLPDGRGRIFIGAGQGYGKSDSVGGENIPPSGAPLVAKLIGQWGGEDTHTLITAEIPTISTGGTIPANTVGIDSTTLTTGSAEAYYNSPVSVVGSFTTVPLVGGGSVGGDGSHNNLQPWQVVGGWIIKT